MRPPRISILIRRDGSVLPSLDMPALAAKIEATLNDARIEAKVGYWWRSRPGFDIPDEVDAAVEMVITAGDQVRLTGPQSVIRLWADDTPPYEEYSISLAMAIDHHLGDAFGMTGLWNRCEWLPGQAPKLVIVHSPLPAPSMITDTMELFLEALGRALRSWWYESRVGCEVCGEPFSLDKIEEIGPKFPERNLYG